MPKSIHLIFCIFVLLFAVKTSFAQKNVIDVVQLRDETIHFGHVLKNSLNDSVITFSSTQNDSFLINKINIREKFKLKYEFEDSEFKVVNNNPYTSSFLSFLLPGWGQFYNEEYLKGSTQLGVVVIAGVLGDAIKPFYLYNNIKSMNIADFISIGVQFWSIIDAPISSINKNGELRSKYDDYFEQLEKEKRLGVIQNNSFFSLKISF